MPREVGLMAEIKISLTVEYYPSADPKPYRVVTAKNTVVPKVGTFLTADEVEDLINSGVTVNVRKRVY